MASWGVSIRPVRLTEAIGESGKSGKEMALIFLDLDHFKYVNDCYGHLAGSQVLREVGFILKRTIELDDATVARYGGDEFVMILPNTKLADAVRLGEQICHAIAKQTFLEREWGFSNPPLNLRGVLSASIGIAQHLPTDDA